MQNPDSGVPAVSSPAPKFYFGTVMHRRLRPARHRFVYPVFFIAVPLSRPASLENRWFSVNRWNVFGFRFADHGAQDGSDPLAWIRALLQRNGLDCADGEVWLQTFPRVLGYVFNPVSFWYCHDAQGALRAILCEVNNTFGERHRYLLAHADTRTIGPHDALEVRKVLHVSPFNDVRGNYRFHFDLRPARTLARIDYHDEAGDILHTSIAGELAPYDARTLARAFFAYPMMTFGVIARIHWQAVRLWWKRVPFFSKPAPPPEQVTR